MKLFILSLTLLVVPQAPVPTLDCTPIRDAWLSSGVVGQETVPDSRDDRPWPADTTSNIVPSHEIWIIKSVSIGQKGEWPPAQPRQYAIQIQLFWGSEPVSSWSQGLKECINTVTPLCSKSWERGFVLEPNERLTARASGTPEGELYIMSLGWRLPKACRAEWLRGR